LSSNVLVTVWFDYTCPHCHIGLGRLDALSGEMALTVDRRPYLLRPDAPLNTVLVPPKPSRQPMNLLAPVRLWRLWVKNLPRSHFPAGL